MIHFVASGPSVLKTWRDGLVKTGDIVCGINGAVRYIKGEVDWWAVGDRGTLYDKALDPPVDPTPTIGILTDEGSVKHFSPWANIVVVHPFWPLQTSRWFTAPAAASYLMETCPARCMTCYGVDLAGVSYAWGSACDTNDEACAARWHLERMAWTALVRKYGPKRFIGLPGFLLEAALA